MTDSAATSHAPATATLDALAVRADVPILARGPNTGRELAFLDSAASSMKPRQVLDAMRDTYESAYANVHRGVYRHAAEATARFEGARGKVATFIGASSPREVVFTRGTTEAINLVAQAWGRAELGEGDVVVLSELEHHSNLVPWQQACLATGATLRYIPVDDHGMLVLDDLDSLVRPGERLRMVSVVHVSNTLGTVVPVAEITRWARRHEGALVMLDGAQSVPHRPVDVAALDIDLLAFSGHKMLGPTGIGVLWGRESVLAAMPPWQHGGEMIRRVEYDATTFNDLPWKFEAGTPAIVEAVGLGAAVDYLDALGMEAVAAWEHELTAALVARLSDVPGLAIVGPPAEGERSGVVSFTLDCAHPHDIASILDQHDVNVRAGNHCTQPLLRRLGSPATARASVYAYNVEEDLDRLVEALHAVRRTFGAA